DVVPPEEILGISIHDLINLPGAEAGFLENDKRFGERILHGSIGVVRSVEDALEPHAAHYVSQISRHRAPAEVQKGIRQVKVHIWQSFGQHHAIDCPMPAEMCNDNAGRWACLA